MGTIIDCFHSSEILSSSHKLLHKVNTISIPTFPVATISSATTTSTPGALSAFKRETPNRTSSFDNENQRWRCSRDPQESQAVSCDPCCRLDCTAHWSVLAIMLWLPMGAIKMNPCYSLLSRSIAELTSVGFTLCFHILFCSVTWYSCIVIVFLLTKLYFSWDQFVSDRLLYKVQCSSFLFHCTLNLERGLLYSLALGCRKGGGFRSPHAFGA